MWDLRQQSHVGLRSRGSFDDCKFSLRPLQLRFVHATLSGAWAGTGTESGALAWPEAHSRDSSLRLI